MADYAPDGGGNSGDQGWEWKVEAVESRTFKDTNLKVMALLNDKEGLIKGITGFEEKLTLIAKKLNISYDAANNGVIRKKYNVEK
ncbi:hypothetical protein [Abyssogena phaseoliformis symbiont]|uniref:DUF4875 domain-containing protein n=1 Tax=Abyssogena phaseoliformis symbiont TaxID=596095 RepID=UPI0019152953|nr:hypothetical protein [Abyssogena phaseoliformis symbiont]MBW5289464.1 hypothetical protein [Candidatus Ruthia sp. Apha_13_S6]